MTKTQLTGITVYRVNELSYKQLTYFPLALLRQLCLQAECEIFI